MYWIPIVASGLLVKDVAVVLRSTFAFPPEDTIVVCDPLTDEPMRGCACVEPGDAIRVFRTHIPPAPGMHFTIDCSSSDASPSPVAPASVSVQPAAQLPVDAPDVVADLTLDAFFASQWVGLCAGHCVVHGHGPATRPVASPVYIPLVASAMTVAELEVTGLAAALAAIQPSANVIVVRAPSTLLWNILKDPEPFLGTRDTLEGPRDDAGVRLSLAVRTLMYAVKARKRVTLTWFSGTAPYRRAALRRFRRSINRAPDKCDA